MDSSYSTLEFTDLLNDKCYKMQHMKDNNKQSDYTIKNYRNNNCENNHHTGPLNIGVYNGLGINNGNVGGCNILSDDEVTRPHIQQKPEDALQEQIKEMRYFKPLPFSSISDTRYNINNSGICKNNINTNSCDFLTSTTVSTNPQAGFDASFDRIGINTRNHLRKDATFYKNADVNASYNSYGSHGRFSGL